jgi:hypothetical protein
MGKLCGRRVARLYRQLIEFTSTEMRLGGSNDPLDPFPQKPRGMHWRTYERCSTAQLKRLRELKLFRPLQAEGISVGSPEIDAPALKIVEEAQATELSRPLSKSSRRQRLFSPWPRPAMPMTSLTCTSRQARTQAAMARYVVAVEAFVLTGAPPHGPPGSAALDHPRNGLALNIVELRGLARRFAVEQAVRAPRFFVNHSAAARWPG